MENLPLSGIRVLDISELVSGPYCTRLLDLFGAEVIKIERPDRPDPSRRYTHFPDGIPDSCKTGLFSYLNTNKKSITLNWQTRKGSCLLEQLIAQSDILVENSEPGRLNLASLHTMNDSLIVTSISYFGQNGPYSQHDGADAVAQALGGLMKLTGLPNSEPLKIAGPQAEYQAGLNAAIATMGSLLLRDETGSGDHIDVSVMECLASILEGVLLRYEYDGTVRERNGTRHPIVYPSTVLPCKDGYVHVDAGADWDTFCRFTDIPELLEFDTTQLHTHANEIDELLKPWLAELSKDEVFHRAQEWRLPFAKVMTIEELFHDPHLQARDFFLETEDHISMGMPFKMSSLEQTPDVAPQPGDHNEEVYCGLLGYDPGELFRFRGMGII